MAVRKMLTGDAIGATQKCSIFKDDSPPPSQFGDHIRCTAHSDLRVCEQQHSTINNGSNRVRHRRPIGIGKQHWSLESTNSDERTIMLCEREYCQETGGNNDNHNDPHGNYCHDSVVILKIFTPWVQHPSLRLLLPTPSANCFGISCPQDKPLQTAHFTSPHGHCFPVNCLVHRTGGQSTLWGQ